MTIDEFRSDPALADMLRRILEMEVFQSAVAAIEESNAATEERAIAAMLPSDPMVETRLLNQQVGRRAWLKDLRLCAIPIKPANAAPQASYGADEAFAELSAAGQPWGVDAPQ